MRKLLTFLTTLTAAVAVIVLFTACEQFLKDPEDFLSYWASEAFVKDHSIGEVARPDEVGVPCVSSSVDVHIMLTVHNPKGFSFVMPSSSAPAGIVEFKELSEPPEVETHYDLERTSSSRLELTYKEAFLQKYEQGSGSLNPTITLKATDGRVFKKTYTFGIKSNTPPPKPAVVLAKQTNASPNYYVLCIDTKDLVASSAIVNGKHIHDDIAYVTVNGTRYNLKMNDAHNGFSEKPAAPSFLADGTGLMPAGSESLPSGAWVLYYKTDIQIGPSNPPTTYHITLIDKGGVTSDEAAATIEANSSTHTVTFKVVDEEGGTLTGSYGSTSQTASGSSTATLIVPRGENVTFAAAPAFGWKVDSWSSNVNVDSSDNKKATLSNVSDDETVTVEFKKVIVVEGTNNLAWTLLQNAVKVADPNSTITIDGKIEASSGNSGEIEIDETLTIEGKTGPDKDILDANGLSRIFKVASGKTLTLKNLTLTGGKATGTGDAGSGGAIFARDASEIKIENCIITGNEAYKNGGGLNVEGTPTTITNCTFTGNTAKNGGGIYIMETSTRRPVVTISGGTIGGTDTDKANKATGTGSDGNGGGIYVGDWCDLRLNSTLLIIGNQAAKGGGVYAKNVLQVSMQGGTQIAVDNDVYLHSNSWIKVFSTLSNDPAARITVPDDKYLTSTKVLDGNAALLNSEHGKFAVTPKGDEYWTVGNDGRLTKDKAAIFNNITNDQIEAAYYSMIYDEYNMITDRTILLGKLVLYKTNKGNYGIMHVTEVNNTSNSGEGYIKFDYKTFNQYGEVIKKATGTVVNGGECFQFEHGGDPGDNNDFYLQNKSDGTKSFNPLHTAKFYILSN